MDIIGAFNYWLVISMQNIGDWLTPVMQFFTWLGYPQAYMIVIAVIYWSFDRKLGLRVALFLTFSASINSILKQALHAPRPYWVDTRIKVIHASNGFGMPSGHAQAVTAWLFLARYLKKSWFWIVAIAIIFFVGLSRIYLGVHFPSQVIAGWLIGIIIVIIFIRLEPVIVTWINRLKLRNQLLVVFMVCIILILTGGLFVFLLQDWNMPVEWIRNAAVHMEGGRETILSSVGMESVVSNAGGFLGAAIGGILMRRAGGFDSRGKAWKRLVRCITGIAVILLLYLLLKNIGPDQDNTLPYCLWRFLAFFLILFVEIYLVPLLLIRLNLLSRFSGRQETQA